MVSYKEKDLLCLSQRIDSFQTQYWLWKTTSDQSMQLSRKGGRIYWQLNRRQKRRQTRRRIQLVITDIMMPLMEGGELIKSLRQVKPDIKIIAISGYTDTNIINNKEIKVDAFVKKPFERIDLLSTVRRLLDTGIRNLPLY